MKRYVISACFACFVVLAIGLFLGLASAKGLPGFRLETAAGDGKEAEALLLAGWYQNGPYAERVTIGAEGSEYESERSGYERFRAGSISVSAIPELVRLTEAYPGFMRGRTHASTLLDYYHDDEWVIRLQASLTLVIGDRMAGFHNFRIDMLDKKTGRKRSLTAPLPDVLRNRQAVVADIQKIGDKLHTALITFPWPFNGQREDAELRVYQISLQDGEVTGGEPLLLFPGGADDQVIRVGEVREPDMTAPRKYLLLKAYAPDSDDRILLYSYEQGKTHTLTLPAKSPEFSGSLQYYRDDSALVRLLFAADEIRMERYRLPGFEREREILLTPEDLRAETFQNFAWGENRLYILHDANGLPAVSALDLTDGNVIWRGVVRAESSAGELEKLGISHILIRP